MRPNAITKRSPALREWTKAVRYVAAHVTDGRRLRGLRGGVIPGWDEIIHDEVREAIKKNDLPRVRALCQRYVDGWRERLEWR